MDIRIEKRGFIMNIGKSFLAYATIEPIEIRVDCKRRKSETINLTGRGLFQIMDGCKVSSPLFSIILPKEIGSVNYTSLDTSLTFPYGNVHLWNASHFNSETELESLPSEKLHDFSFEYTKLMGNDLLKNTLVIVPLIICVLTFVLCIVGIMNVFRGNRNRQRETFL